MHSLSLAALLSALSFSLGFFFHDVVVEAFVGWEGDFRLFVSDDENVAASGGESLSVGVLQVDNIEAAQMSFDVKDSSDSTDVVTAGDVGQVSWLVGNPAHNSVVFQIILDWISLVNIWVWESDGSGVVGDDVWDLVGSDGFLDDLAELEVGFSAFDADEGEPALIIIQKSVVFAGLDDGQNVHNTDWEFGVSSDFMVDLKTCLLILGDDGDLFAVSC